MARYKDYNFDQMKMIPVSFDQQILPGSFKYSLAWLVDNELDLSAFASYYRNDDNGRPAYDPALLLKIVIYAYSRGIISSRRIERLCRENITFMALTADTRPHFTTIADFVSRSPEAIGDLFIQIVLMCDQLGLIGKEMFAIDGKLNRAVRRRILSKPRETDQHEQEASIVEQEQVQIEKLRSASKKIDGYLADTGFRSRDPRFKDHKEAPERNNRKDTGRFTQADFRIDKKRESCRCPAGHAIWLKARNARIGHHLFMQFQAYEKDCAGCH